MTNFNERTNTLHYKNISLTLYSQKGWCWLCVRGQLETGTDCYILTQVLLTLAALLSHLSWVAQPWVTEGFQFGILSPTDSNSNWLKPAVSWLYFCLAYTCFRCSSAYLHRCISWLMARSWVNTLYFQCTYKAAITYVLILYVIWDIKKRHWFISKWYFIKQFRSVLNGMRVKICLILKLIVIRICLWWQ